MIVMFMFFSLREDTTYGISRCIGVDMKFNILVGCSMDRSGSQSLLQFLEGFFTLLRPSRGMNLFLDRSTQLRITFHKSMIVVHVSHKSLHLFDSRGRI